MNFLATVYKIN